MCGRYSLGVPTEVLAKAFALASTPQVPLRYNIAPTQDAAVIRVSSKDGQRKLHLLKWGLIPSWADDPKIGSRLINARAESAPDKPAFRSAFKRRRCLIPADAFYEWQKGESGNARGRKQPYAIKMADGSPFAFAGLWETWRDPVAGKDVETFTILTTEPNDVTRPLHNRMPAIVRPEDYDRWLDPREHDPERLKGVIRTTEDGTMVAYPVSSRVNSPANDDAGCIEPAVPERTSSENGRKKQAISNDQPTLFDIGESGG